MEFENVILYNNLSYLIQQKNLKIGEFETKAGVSPGYISRTLKDGKTKPGIDFVMNAAQILNISIDNLLKWDLSNLTNTEKSIVEFLVKLNEDTVENKVSWELETLDELTDLLIKDQAELHPLLSCEEFVSVSGGGYPETQDETVYFSNKYGKYSQVKSDGYKLSLNNKAYLYLMTFKSSNYYEENDDYSRELWMYIPEHGKEFICGSDSGFCINTYVDMLCASITENLKHLKVSDEALDVIEAFMNNDL